MKKMNYPLLCTEAERTFGKVKFFSIFISVALLSNVTQYCFMTDLNGYFGGLSGVVYGVIGYSGVLIGPALLGLLADRFGLEMIFSFVGVLTLVMCALCWYILSAKSKRMVTDN